MWDMTEVDMTFSIYAVGCAGGWVGGWVEFELR